jgi:transcriptional regulator with XRE-family HTH domain
MNTKTLLARLFRALSGLSLRRYAEKAGIDPSLVAQYDLGTIQPGEENLARMGAAVGLKIPDGEKVLRVAEALRQGRQRAATSLDLLLGDLVSHVYERVQSLPLPASAPKAEDRVLAEEQWGLLRNLSEGQQRAAVLTATELQTWALLERVCEESAAEASRDLKRAAWLAELGELIAERVRGPEGWRKRVRGYALACRADVLRAGGDVAAAEACRERTRGLWAAGTDPEGWLEPGRWLEVNRERMPRGADASPALDAPRPS